MTTLPKTIVLAGFIAGLVGGLMGLWYLDGPRELWAVDASQSYRYAPQVHPVLIALFELFVALLTLSWWEASESTGSSPVTRHYLDDAI